MAEITGGFHTPPPPFFLSLQALHSSSFSANSNQIFATTITEPDSISLPEADIALPDDAEIGLILLLSIKEGLLNISL